MMRCDAQSPPRSHEISNSVTTLGAASTSTPQAEATSKTSACSKYTWNAYLPMLASAGWRSTRATPPGAAGLPIVVVSSLADTAGKHGSVEAGLHVWCRGALRRGQADGAAHQSAISGARAWSSKGSHPELCVPPTNGSSATRHTTVSTAASASRPTHESRHQRATRAPALELSDAAPPLAAPCSGATSPGAGASATVRSASGAVATPSMKSPSCAGGKLYDQARLCFQNGRARVVIGSGRGRARCESLGPQPHWQA